MFTLRCFSYFQIIQFDFFYLLYVYTLNDIKLRYYLKAFQVYINLILRLTFREAPLVIISVNAIQNKLWISSFKLNAIQSKLWIYLFNTLKRYYECFNFDKVVLFHYLFMNHYLGFCSIKLALLNDVFLEVYFTIWIV